eukprot:m.91392 g.91392  ORF g.91392 m.91392 type:complete len:72 (+) comp11930_c0_seq3:4872-5087(+)
MPQVAIGVQDETPISCAMDHEDVHFKKCDHTTNHATNHTSVGRSVSVRKESVMRIEVAQWPFIPVRRQAWK